MGYSHYDKTVATTATKISPTITSSDRHNNSKQTLVVTNTDADDIFVGGAGVTTAAYGVKIAGAGGVREFECDVNDELYAVVASGTAVVKVLARR